VPSQEETIANLETLDQVGREGRSRLSGTIPHYLMIVEIVLRLSVIMWPKCDRAGSLANIKKGKRVIICNGRAESDRDTLSKTSVLLPSSRDKFNNSNLRFLKVES